MPFFIVQYYLMANDGHKYLFSGKRNSQDRASWGIIQKCINQKYV